MLARVLFAPDAPLSDKLLGVLFILIFAGFLFLLGWAILKVLRLSKSAAGGAGTDIVTATMASVSQGVKQRAVVFKFTTYTGFGLWLVRSTQTYTLPYDVAQQVLRKLLRHNCTWGLLGPGLVFVPFLSLAEFWQRRREIARQKEGFAPVMRNNNHHDEKIV
jgi:hypothetical protein